MRASTGGGPPQQNGQHRCEHRGCSRARSCSGAGLSPQSPCPSSTPSPAQRGEKALLPPPQHQAAPLPLAVRSLLFLLFPPSNTGTPRTHRRRRGGLHTSQLLEALVPGCRETLHRSPHGPLGPEHQQPPQEQLRMTSLLPSVSSTGELCQQFQLLLKWGRGSHIPLLAPLSHPSVSPDRLCWRPWKSILQPKHTLCWELAQSCRCISLTDTELSPATL